MRLRSRVVPAKREQVLPVSDDPRFSQSEIIGRYRFDVYSLNHSARTQTSVRLKIKICLLFLLLADNQNSAREGCVPLIRSTLFNLFQ